MNKDILRLLRDNGRMSFTEIGEQLGISRVAAMKRVKKLEEEGIHAKSIGSKYIYISLQLRYIYIV